MIPAPDVVLLSRLQFAITALYHFLFVPLTLGLSFLIAIMETVYVMTKRDIWRQMTKYWGVLFGINFAMGVATGITMEFQFGTNWAYYSHFVGDIFGVPLAIEGLMAFFLEATFIGLFFFGWDRLSAIKHCLVTWALAFATNLSALWILIANGWMQHPVGAYFDFQTMRMEINDFYAVLFNPVAQAKFVHTVSAGYVTGSLFVLAISSYFLLRQRNFEFAKRSFTVAASFGLASALSVVVLGDESGYLANESQKMKLAAMEGMWHTEPPPAAITLFGIPDQHNHRVDYSIRFPYVLGLIATRSLNTPLLGINELMRLEKTNIQNGMKAYTALEALRKNPQDKKAKATFTHYQADLGYGLLLKRHAKKVAEATKQDIDQTIQDTVPNVAPLFWSFRLMVGLGFFFIFLFSGAFYLSSIRKFDKSWFLKLAVLSLPLPWLAAESGWIVAEYGRQPWVVQGMLPTFMGASGLTSGQVFTSLIGFILFYSILAVVEVFLMVKYIRLGPDGMKMA